MAGIKVGSTNITNVKVGSTQIKQVYVGTTKVWQYWVYNTGSLSYVSGSSGGEDFTSGTVTLGQSIRVQQVHLWLHYIWGGSNTTSYGMSMEGRVTGTSNWVELGSWGGEILRPNDVTQSVYANTSAANKEIEIDAIRVSGWGGIYCTYREVQGYITQWYTKG